MSNRICRVEVRERLLDPAQSELWVCVMPERQTATTEIHGRLAGPRCAYATTVEVAYPLRPFPQQPPGLPGLVRRVVIPEASWWEPECPFLYEGSVELSEDGETVDRRQVICGLRSFLLGPNGLRVNGRPAVLRGRLCEDLHEAQAHDYRAAGVNALIVAATKKSEAVWSAADRFGFLVLGQLGADADSLALAESLAERACALGWLIDQQAYEQAGARAILTDWIRSRAHLRLGMRLTAPLGGPLPTGLRFIAGPAELLRACPSPLPQLVWESDGDEVPDVADVSATTAALGSVRA